MKKTVKPPFYKGDWLAVTTEYAEMALGVSRVFQADEAAEYVGKDCCETGWRYRGLDSSHFKIASRSDVNEEIMNLEEKRQEIDERIRELDDYLEELDRKKS